MARAKVLLATNRGTQDDARAFFSGAIQPFLEENVFRGRRKGLVVCEAMLYRMHFDFRSATDARLMMGRATEDRLAMLQVGLDATARMLNGQFEATIGRGKRPLPPLRLGFEDYVMRLNNFNKGAIRLAIEPQHAGASFIHAEAESLVETLGGIREPDGKIECMSRVISLLAEATAIRNRLICGMIDEELDRLPGLAIALPRGPGNVGLHRGIDERRCDVSLVSDGSFMTFLEQAVGKLISGEMGSRGIDDYSRLHLRYLEYIKKSGRSDDWKRLSLEAALHAVSDASGPEGPK